MITNLLAHLTLFELPASLLLFAAGAVVGATATLAARRIRLQ